MNLHIATPVEAVFGEAASGDPISGESTSMGSTDSFGSASPRTSAGAPSLSADVLVQLRKNLSQLDELHSRLRFVMAEISYLLKR